MGRPFSGGLVEVGAGEVLALAGHHGVLLNDLEVGVDFLPGALEDLELGFQLRTSSRNISSAGSNAKSISGDLSVEYGHGIEMGTGRAKGAFDQAARMTRLLRNQENQLASSTDAIDDQEGAFNDSLVELYGTPYPADVGAGRTYAQGYTGPDTLPWFVTQPPS